MWNLPAAGHRPMINCRSGLVGSASGPGRQNHAMLTPTLAVPSAVRLRRRAQPLLGTLVEIALPAEDDIQLRRMSEPAFTRLRSFHAAMSFHEPHSDVHRIACAHAGETLRVNLDTWQVLRLAFELELASGGVFNVAVGAVLVDRGALPRLRPPADANAEPGESGRASLVLGEPGEVHVLQPVCIDLGGIAKGAAVDAAVEAALLSGATQGVVNAGGDLRVFGSTRHEIDVRAPSPDRRRVRIGDLRDGAIATSEAAAAPTALVCPRGRAAAWQSLSVSVLAPTCAVADALTKLLAIEGPAAAPLLRRYQAVGFGLDEQGEVHRV